jgi:hypothetical protein
MMSPSHYSKNVRGIPKPETNRSLSKQQHADDDQRDPEHALERALGHALQEPSTEERSDDDADARANERDRVALLRERRPVGDEVDR